MFGRLTQVKGAKTVEVALDDEIDLQRINKWADGKQPSIELKIADGRTISPDQRKLIYALINDLCRYTGDVPDEWKERFKFMVQGIFGVDHFSLSDCSVTVANEMILTILEFLFEEDIPFSGKEWQAIPDDFPREMLAIKHRRCVICGRRADVAHYEAVGNRSRKLVDHRKFEFMSLCRVHHTEQHQRGVVSFCQYHHIKPVKLSEDDLIKLHVMTRKQMDKLDAEKG